jgi:hypothetical protein
MIGLDEKVFQLMALGQNIVQMSVAMAIRGGMEAEAASPAAVAEILAGMRPLHAAIGVLIEEIREMNAAGAPLSFTLTIMETKGGMQ